MSRPLKKPPRIQGDDFAKAVARLAEDNRAEEIVILDLRQLSAVADFFVIATGTSDRQLRAIADQVDEFGSKHGQRIYGRSGYENATWVLLDYVDVVVHLFDREHREFYDLELLWGDAPRLDWRESVS